jgi:HK97 family phage portal protein
VKSLAKVIQGTVLNKSPVAYAPSWANKWTFGRSQANGNMETQMRQMGAVGTLFSIVNRTSNATAQVDWKLFTKSASGDDEDRTEVTRHLALQIWEKPNPFFTRQTLVESSQQHIDLTGESYWLVSRLTKNGPPSELWPIRPDRIVPVPDAEEFLAGYTYLSPEGEHIDLGLNEVIALKMPNPLDVYRGMGPVQSILVDLDSTRYSAEWNRNFFVNSAEPGGIIELDTKLGDPEWQEFTGRWREQHQGVANAHRVAVIERGKWVNRTFSMRDMQFAELRKVSSEVIREAFGIHGHMLGLSDSINRANAEAAEVTFARWLVTPRLERIKQALNCYYLPMFGPSTANLEFDYCDHIPDDRELDAKELTSKADAALKLIQAGWYAPEVLEAVELPAMSFGQPDADPERELLIDLVKGAPTLAPLILPMLGYDLPEVQPPPVPEPVPKPPGQNPPPLPPGQNPPPQPPGSEDMDPALEAIIRDYYKNDIPERLKTWVAEELSDDSSCEPCKKNDGKRYFTRADAYEDYPDGKNYKNCDWPPNCRGVIIRRNVKKRT